MSSKYDLFGMLKDTAIAGMTPGLAPPSIPEQSEWPRIDDEMSNFDHDIPDGIDEKLRAGNCYCIYNAWDFNAHVWFDGGKFFAHVNQYRKHVDTIEADDLRGIMRGCSEKYGYE